ncbi:MAG: MFS transporter [Methylophilaceae bacterium 17-44-8]|nr:MAG: MFS transporter [Methylophilales bacterium 28-44-11]OZA05225.1 MAG: MFS transporter [Methylophilaceae bacterium 17-44-8]
MSNQFSLMSQKRFLPFFLTQFLGALNDNLFKTVLITLVAFRASSLGDVDGAMMATLLPGLFILPFFLFSATAGQIADKYEKSQIIRLVKMFEIWIMVFASVGFYLHNLWLLASALFLMGMHSTLFGPVKYAYLPQQLNQQELVGGNGMVEMGSFVAILFGQILGAWLATHPNYEMFTSMAVISIGVIGYIASKQIPATPALTSKLTIQWNPIIETYQNVKLIWAQQTLWLAIVAISWFWFFGATLLAQFPNMAKLVLHGDEGVFILMLTVFSIGVGVGSLLCERLSRGKAMLGLVMIGGIGMSCFTVDIYWVSTHVMHVQDAFIYTYQQFLSIPLHWRLLADIALLGVFGGFYIVPLYVLIQTLAEPAYRSRIIAANNIMNALFMVVSALFSIALFKYGVSIPQLFLITALVNLLVMVYLCVRQPNYYRSFKAWFKRTHA